MSLLSQYGLYAVVALLVMLTTTLASNLLSIGGITPDLLILVVVAFALEYGQLPGVIFGFSTGLMFDLISTDVLGSNALVKLLAGYIAGFFHHQDSSFRESVGTPRYIIATLVCSFAHNAVYYLLYTRPADIPYTKFFLQNGIAAALYTTALALLPFFYASRKRGDEI